MMKILITAGGTSEKIDEVRKITNTATGRLGSLIAEQFAEKHGAEVTYVCSQGALTAGGSNVKTAYVESVEDLQNMLTKLFMQEKYDAVIHSMAVSDYRVRAVTDGVQSVVCGRDGKISSDADELVIFMEKTPKIIKMIKELMPDTILVGFKLLTDTSEDNLVKTAHKLLVKNNCDFVLANDLRQISGDNHVGLLVKPGGTFERLNTKQEIAAAIVKNVLTVIEGRI